MNFDLVSQPEMQKVAMTKNLNLLTKRTAKAPFTMSENDNTYSLFLILSGVRKKNIFLDVNKNRNEVSVYVAKKNRYRHEAAFWVFAVPHDGILDRMKTTYKESGIEITIPKNFLSLAAS